MAGASARTLRDGFRQLASEAEIREALEKAFDYRGDITITRQGWQRWLRAIFTTAATAQTLADSVVRIIPTPKTARRPSGEYCVHRCRGADVYWARHGGGQDASTRG